MTNETVPLNASSSNNSSIAANSTGFATAPFTMTPDKINANYKIDNLTKDNYFTWIAQMDTILELLGLNIDPLSPEATSDEGAMKRRLAYHQILLRCDAEHIAYINSTSLHNSVSAMKSLSERYNGQGICAGINILQRNIQMRFSESNIREGIDAMRCSYQRLIQSGFKVEQYLIVANLMVALPPRYGFVIASFSRETQESIKFEEVVAAVMTELIRLSLDNEPKAIALAANTHARRSQADRNRRCANCGKRGHSKDICRAGNVITCTYCRNKGHSESECRTKVRNQSASSSNHKSANVALKTETSEVGFAFSALNAKVSKNLNKRSKNSTLKVEINSHNVRRVKLSPNSDTIEAKPAQLKKVRFLTTMKTDSNFMTAHRRFKSIKRLSHDASETLPIIKSVILKPVTKLHQHVSSGALSNDAYEDELLLTSDIENASDDKISLSNYCPPTPTIKEMEIYKMCFQSSNGNSSLINKWLIDSGASMHLCRDSFFFNEIKSENNEHIRIANGNLIKISGYGNLSLAVKTDTEIIKLNLLNVAFIPELHVNLVSVKALTQDDSIIKFTRKGCYMESRAGIFHIATNQTNAYEITLADPKLALVCSHEWHRKLAHRNLADVKRQTQFGLKITKCTCKNDCSACILGKATQLPFLLADKPLKRLELLTSDLCGQITPKSLCGHEYFLTVTDVFSDFTFTAFLKAKHEAKQSIMNFIEFIHTQTSEWPKTFRSDGGGEFINTELNEFFNARGIKIERTVPYTPQQNGIAERINRTLNDAARTMLIASNLPKNLWHEAIANAVYTQNRIVHNNRDKSPFELLFERQTSSHYIEFGAPVYVNTNIINRDGKFTPRAMLMRVLNVDDKSKGLRIWNGNKIIVERNVRFTDYTNDKESESVPKPSQIVEGETLETSSENDIIPLRRSARIKEQLSLIAEQIQDPSTFKQAMSSEHRNDWLLAIQEELTALSDNNTFEICDLPHDKSAVGCRWVFKTKTSEDDTTFRARLVAKGFNQKFGEDFHDVFAPVARSSTIRLLLSMAGKSKWFVNQLDVKSAFLNGTIEEEVYMIIPEGMDVHDDKKVLRLRKAIYGLKQAARNWNHLLNNCLSEVGFEPSLDDPCLYSYKDNTDISFLAVHVDDIIISSTSIELFETIYLKLSQKFTLKKLGEPSMFLGVEICKNEHGYSINQSKYIIKIATQHQLEMSKPQMYPMHPGYYKFPESDFIDNKEFRQLIGSLLYVSTNTRPDISLSVTLLSQRICKPRKCDLQEARNIVKYLHTTKDYKLSLNNFHARQEITSFSDANFAECLTTGKSLTGTIIFVNGGAISWKCKKQTLVAMSTTESEFYALNETTKELLWLSSLVKLFHAIETPLKIHIDNQSTIKMVENEDFMARTKYIGVRYHSVREYSKRKLIKLIYCASTFNIADLLTKPLPFPRLKFLRESTGILENAHEKETTPNVLKPF